MSDPQPAHLKKKPPRAEPLQPDAPTRGDDAESEAGLQTESTEKLKKQTEDAVKNVSEGYD